MLPPISKEQTSVLNAIQAGHNVICNSVAGSGKTTCSLHIATDLSHMKILLLTYSSKLKIESRKKAQENNLQNIEIHSYHSFGYNIYGESLCNKDKGIQMLIDSNAHPTTPLAYNLIILDEAQDINPLYFQFIHKIQRDNNYRHQLVLFGDDKQSIFGFMGSDERFFTMADKLYNESHDWKICSLSQSYRITIPMANFLNYCMLDNPRIVSTKESTFKPRYLICETFKYYENFKYNKGIKEIWPFDKSFPFLEIQYYLETLHYDPSDIFVLAPSVKNLSSPCRILENIVKTYYKDKVPVFCPISDESELDEELIKGKMIFSTFHQAKGLERKVVIVFGFDNFYFLGYNRNINEWTCPNEFYVAVTRGLEHITVIHDKQNDYLTFLNKSLLSEHCEILRGNVIDLKSYGEKDKIITCPTKLISYVPSKLLENCYKKLSCVTIHKKEKMIKITPKVRGCNDTSEGVFEITGTAIPSYFQYLKTNGNMDILLKNKKYKYPDKPDTISNLLKIANNYLAFKSGYIHKLTQIKRFDWITQKQLDMCIKRIEKFNISENAEFEKTDSFEMQIIQQSIEKVVQIRGEIDCVDGDTVYEFKCAQNLQQEHALQLAIYMYMTECRFKNYYLYNILTAETIEIKADMTTLEEIIRLLIQEKYNSKKELSDDDFLSKYNFIKTKN